MCVRACMPIRQESARQNKSQNRGLFWPLVVFARSGTLLRISFEPWRSLYRQMATGGLHCPVSVQRRLALFSLAALCVSGLF